MEWRASHLRGAAGEDIARRFLETRGYRLLARRVRVGRHEIDLVVERGELLVAVEVKWRRAGASTPPGRGPAEAWTPAQRRRAHAAVLELMANLPRGAERPWRMDLVTLEERADGLTLVHHRAPWTPGDSFW